MRCPSYLIKKQDIYYFRQACPRHIKSKIGKREIIKSLGVRDKTIAIRSRKSSQHVADCLVGKIYFDKPMLYMHFAQHLI